MKKRNLKRVNNERKSKKSDLVAIISLGIAFTSIITNVFIAQINLKSNLKMEHQKLTYDRKMDALIKVSNAINHIYDSQSKEIFDSSINDLEMAVNELEIFLDDSRIYKISKSINELRSDRETFTEKYKGNPYTNININYGRRQLLKDLINHKNEIKRDILGTG